MGLRVATIAALLAVWTHGAPARADNVDQLIKQLANDGSDKVRLSAALNLAKLGDPRAILPLVKALGNDDDENVRGAAAVGLGELVNDKTKSVVKNLAVSTLQRATASDASGLVRKQAAQALKAIGVAGGAGGNGDNDGNGRNGGNGGNGGGPQGIYVNIGPMSSKTGNSSSNPKLQALMVKVATSTMKKVASNMALTWPGGVPTKAQLQAKSTAGFYVDGTLNSLTVKESGSSATVSCKISMLLAGFPEKDIFGLLNGGASVQASGSASEVALAQEDCVSAVIEDLIAKKIVPTINAKVTP